LMVFAFAGDSTMTTFTDTLANCFDQLQGCRWVLKQGYSITGLAFQPAREFQLEEYGGHDCG